MSSPLTPLVSIPAATFAMGSERHYSEEKPVTETSVEAFAIEQHPVTNAQFRRFVDETGYLTVAERPLDPDLYPGAPEENLVPGSLVFTPTPGPVDLSNLSQWWRWVTGASWRCPTGPQSTVDDLDDHPVVHVVAEDAEAYADWCGRRIPTEIEWERAARGGLDGAEFSWGDQQLPDGKRMAKYFEGNFPYRNRPSDGYERTAPVGTYPANGFGLVDMCGNVWEWTSDWYSSERPASAGCCGVDRQRMVDSIDPMLPGTPIPRRVIKGGSHLCADEYCRRYRPAARRPQMIDTGMSHIGFRCAADAAE